MIPAQYRVIVTHRPKYACRSCEGAIVQAPAPERLIKNGMPTDELWEKLNQSDLPKLWIPKRENFYWIESIPLLGSGKVDLKRVKTMAAEKASL